MSKKNFQGTFIFIFFIRQENFTISGCLYRTLSMLNLACEYIRYDTCITSDGGIRGNRYDLCFTLNIYIYIQKVCHVFLLITCLPTIDVCHDTCINFFVHYLFTYFSCTFKHTYRPHPHIPTPSHPVIYTYILNIANSY